MITTVKACEHRIRGTLYYSINITIPKNIVKALKIHKDDYVQIDFMKVFK